MRELFHQSVEPAHLRQRHREVRGRDYGGHLDEELQHVDHQHAPQSGVRREHDVQQSDSEQRLPAVEAEEDGGDLYGRQIHGGHDHAVEEEAQVYGAESAHRRGGFARVTQFVEFQIREHSRAPPQPRIEEDCSHARKGESPPLPVARHALRADEVGHQVRRIARKRGGHHRQARQPPRHRSTRGEEFGRVLAGALAEEERGHETDQDRSRGDDPIKRIEMH